MHNNEYDVLGSGGELKPKATGRTEAFYWSRRKSTQRLAKTPYFLGHLDMHIKNAINSYITFKSSLSFPPLFPLT